MRVMYVANNPTGARTLQIPQEVDDLQDRLDRSASADPIEFRVYSDIDLGRLTEKIELFQPDVLHFAAHGDGENLIFAHPSASHAKVNGQQLSTLLSGLVMKPTLIVINACSSDRIAESMAMAGAASFVIGTDASISNDGARAMAAALYRSLANAGSVADAYQVAATNLKLFDPKNVNITLHPKDSIEAARRRRLVDPMRIMAFFPTVDEWLKAKLERPGKHFQPELPFIKFGIAGAPAATRQMVFFTDDETVKPKGKQSLADARSWIVESQAVKSQIWLDDVLNYYGDMNYFATVTTTDARVFSTQSTITAAIQRYYFTELWQGELPPKIADLVKRSIECLIDNDGSRRARSSMKRSVK